MSGEVDSGEMEKKKEEGIVAFLCWVGFLLWTCGLAER